MPIQTNSVLFKEVTKRTLKAQNVDSYEELDLRKLHQETKIKVNTLWRFFKEYRGERRSKTLTKLVKHFKIDVVEITNSISGKDIPKNLTETLRSVWDGTDAHARQIELLIKAVHAIRLDQLKESRL